MNIVLRFSVVAALLIGACSAPAPEPERQEFYAVVKCAHNNVIVESHAGPYETFELCEKHGVSDVIKTFPVSPEIITSQYCETR